jgi:type IV pilus assembly protein PilA
MMMNKLKKILEGKAKGFTLLEILLVVAAIAILAGIVIVAINPAKQLGDTRNSQRKIDVNTILNAAYQYSIDTGYLPVTIASSTCASASTNEICKTGGTCTSLTDLSVLTATGKYIVSIPTDPTGSTTNGSGYYIATSSASGGRLTVCAPSAERGETISVTR